MKYCRKETNTVTTHLQLLHRSSTYGRMMVQFYKIMIWLSSEQLFLTNKAISYSHAKMLEFCSNFFVFGRFTLYEL